MEMDERLSRAEILQRLDREHNRLVATVAELTPAQMIEAGALGTWSVKDILAHLVHWTRFPTHEIKAALAGRQFDYDARHEDEINAGSVAHYRDRSPAEVLVDFERAYDQVLVTVQSLPERAFEPDNELERILGDSVAGVLNNNTYDHYALHEGHIRAWIRQNSQR
ncbi:MAG: maleylpyruvate isomerase N-terminal domain-containing protein [Burkholderiales bacterium]|nr:maleylpyruvate isomerase N-terminal domain-containing protein [Anaerolineae bacterium]